MVDVLVMGMLVLEWIVGERSVGSTSPGALLGDCCWCWWCYWW